MAIERTQGGSGGAGKLRIVLGLAVAAGGIAAALRFYEGDTSGALMMLGAPALFLLAFSLTYRTRGSGDAGDSREPGQETP